MVEVSTESTQDGGVPEDSQVVEASTESIQDGGVPEDLQAVEVSTESTQDGGVPEDSQVVEARKSKIKGHVRNRPTATDNASHLQKEPGSFKQGWQLMGMYCMQQNICSQMIVKHTFKRTLPSREIQLFFLWT